MPRYLQYDRNTMSPLRLQASLRQFEARKVCGRLGLTAAAFSMLRPSTAALSDPAKPSHRHADHVCNRFGDGRAISNLVGWNGRSEYRASVAPSLRDASGPHEPKRDNCDRRSPYGPRCREGLLSGQLGKHLLTMTFSGVAQLGRERPPLRQNCDQLPAGRAGCPKRDPNFGPHKVLAKLDSYMRVTIN
jgi:hypothetical protein